MHEFLRHGVFPEGSEEYGQPARVMTCRRCGEEHGAHDLAVTVHRQLRHPRPPKPLPRPDDLSVPYVPYFRFLGHRFGGRATPPPPQGTDDDR
jgi:hypothetical protein